MTQISYNSFFLFIPIPNLDGIYSFGIIHVYLISHWLTGRKTPIYLTQVFVVGFYVTQISYNSLFIPIPIPDGIFFWNHTHLSQIFAVGIYAMLKSVITPCLFIPISILDGVFFRNHTYICTL